MEWFSDNLLYFILGVLFSIPLGVITNIFTPKFVNWYSRFSQKRSLRRLEQIEKEFEEIVRFKKSKEDLILKSIRTGLIGILAILFTTIMSAFASLLYELPFFRFMPQEFLGAQITASLIVIYATAFWGAIQITSILRILRKVQNFEDYEKETIELKLKLSQTNPVEEKKLENNLNENTLDKKTM